MPLALARCLGAMSRMYDVRIIVFPASLSLELDPFVIHPKQKRRNICVWLTGSHYDRIVPDKTNDLPKRIKDISASPPEVPARGGGGGSASSTARSRKTVWTDSSGIAASAPCPTRGATSAQAVVRGGAALVPLRMTRIWSSETSRTPRPLVHC